MPKNTSLAKAIAEITRKYKDQHDLSFETMSDQANAFLPPLCRYTRSAFGLYATAQRIPQPPDRLYLLIEHGSGPIVDEWARQVLNVMECQ